MVRGIWQELWPFRSALTRGENDRLKSHTIGICAPPPSKLSESFSNAESNAVENFIVWKLLKSRSNLVRIGKKVKKRDGMGFCLYYVVSLNKRVVWQLVVYCVRKYGVVAKADLLYVIRIKNFRHAVRKRAGKALNKNPESVRCVYTI